MKDPLISVCFITLARLTIVYGYVEEFKKVDPDQLEELKLFRDDTPRDVIAESGNETFQKQVQDNANWLNKI